MKNFFYSIAVVFVLSIAVTSCTKEEVKPQAGTPVGGGVSDRGF